ncbi:MAG: FHA domain-containing protein [Planctomycetes bacterium]|nr:FHA domain-containing protein [Planctomycetota bacterium]
MNYGGGKDMTTLLGAPALDAAPHRGAAPCQGPALRIAAGGRTGRVYEIGEALRIGRHPYNEVSVPDRAVSRYHCWITFCEAGFFVEDLGSTNGTFVNGERVLERRRIRAGDRLRAGETEFVFGGE